MGDYSLKANHLKHQTFSIETCSSLQPSCLLSWLWPTKLKLSPGFKTFGVGMAVLPSLITPALFSMMMTIVKVMTTMAAPYELKPLPLLQLWDGVVDTLMKLNPLW